MLDPALRAFIEAPSEGDAQRELESLLQGILPLVQKIAARKLSAYGSKSSFRVEDLEDVSGDVVLVLVKRLQALRTGGEANPIENLESYVATVTFSRCAHRYRLRYPAWSRLKNRLRYVLERERRFALWDIPGEGLHCGLSRWRSSIPDVSAHERFSDFVRNPERWPRSWVPPSSADRADPAPLIADVLDRVRGPVELDGLVSLIASIWRVDRAQKSESPGPPERLAGTDPAPEAAIDRKRFAERLWAEVRDLPLRQRLALLLNLRDAQGAGMLWVFPVMGIASIRAIASALEMSAAELSALWGRLPIDDNTIAGRLGCTRQQVVNLRMSARKRLSHRLGTPDSPRTPGNKANLRDVSTSLKGDK